MSFPSKKFELVLPENGGYSIGLIAASRAGKSTLMKYLYRKYFSDQITLMFSQNSHADIYKDLSKKVIVSTQYFPDLIRDMHTLNHELDNKFKFLVISDDYVGPEIKNDREITKLLTIYRNANMSSIMSFQGRVLVSSVGRNQFNLLMIGKQNTSQEVENVIKEVLRGYMPEGLTIKEMVRFFIKATAPIGQFFVLDTIKGECYLTKLSAEQMAEFD
jgi:hypothetical protein